LRKIAPVPGILAKKAVTQYWITVLYWGMREMAFTVPQYCSANSSTSTTAGSFPETVTFTDSKYQQSHISLMHQNRY
jgi:hypothetical protein